MSWVKSWLFAPDHFDWFTQVMSERGLIRPAQVLLAVVAFTSAIAPLSVLITARHPTEQVVLANATITIFIFAIGLFWLRRWPSRVQSEFSAMAGTVGMAAWSMTQSHPVPAALACAAMAFTGGYLALFHSTKMVLIHVGAAIAVAAVTAVRIARDTDLSTAATAFWLLWFLNLSSVLALRLMSQALRTYAMRAEQDELTALLNRRGFIAALTRRLTNPDATHTHLTMVMIDIDAFKTINDTLGHVEGDRTLTAIADQLRRHASPTTVLCRAGGEEFLVAVLGSSADAEPVSTRLGTAIAELPQRVTASIGTATCELNAADLDDVPEFVQRLIGSADNAMYVAKRLGGNRCHHL